MTDDEPLLPRRVTLLGEAMTPVWRKIAARLDHRDVPSVPVHGMLDVVARHLNGFRMSVPRLADRVHGLMSNVVSNEQATDGDVFRAVGRVEATVDDLLAGYREVCALNACGYDAWVRDRLAGVYRHMLVEIGDWLADLTATVADPEAAAKRRRLPATGHVEIPLALKLTVAPEMGDLTRWIESRTGAK